MKSALYLMLSSLFLIQTLTAQNIAVNNNGAQPHASALLDVSSSSKGVLIPRVNLTGLNDATTIPTPATSLLLYNTNPALAGGAGFYYNEGTINAPVWRKLTTDAETLWRQETGYVELVPSKPLYLQTNVGLGIAAPAEKLHIVEGNIKVGNPVWAAGNDNMIKFGDGDYVRLGEAGEDDALQLFGKYFWFKNSASYSGNVGIGTAAPPAAKLEVNGSFKLTSGSQGNRRVLTSDAAGNATWTLPVTYTSFRAISSSFQSFNANSSASFNGFLDDYDVNNDFFSGIFVAPQQGVYHFDAKADFSINVSNLPGYLRLYFQLYKNGSLLEENIFHVVNNSTTFFQTLTINENVQLLAGDQISLRVNSAANPGTGGFTVNKVAFSGFRTY
ncbi:MAG: hypothetical protein EOO06_04385 [Chitinophagaceae bacterium]|nr:MAG: hypothetical protein EOO06_04385 [Chitinophagaceae bacterium]